MESTTSTTHTDLTGEALKAKRFQMLEDIARELAGEVVFPTYFDADLRLRQVLQDPNQSIEKIASVIALEPLITAKLLRLANSIAFNPKGVEIKDLKSALQRLGMDTVRSTSMAIVMTQLLRAKSMSRFSGITQALWEHSVRTAASARVLARAEARLNPDVALLAGLVHDLGAFYMLYRATQYEDLRDRPDSLKHLIMQWHESIGVSLLGALGLPEEIVEASVDHDHPRPVPSVLRNYSDVIYAANLLSCIDSPWLPCEHDEANELAAEANRIYAHLLPEIEALTKEMLGSFS